MTPGPPLQELIDGVRADVPAGDPLGLLAQASQTAGDLEQTADALLGHFVDQCRRSGHSWSEISGALGVSKQAAHKRFSFDVPDSAGFTNRARVALALAEGEARGLGHGFVGTEHLLLALFASPDGLAARVLDGAGITRAAVERDVLAQIKRGSGSADGALPFTPRAKAAVQNAVGEALQRGHAYVGTEHLLLGLCVDPDSVAAKVLAALGADHDEMARRVTEITGRSRGE
jgi:Clp amino terminal domain, pathogenicity island component